MSGAVRGSTATHWPRSWISGQLVQFRWELAIGGDTLSEEEIAALAQSKALLAEAFDDDPFEILAWRGRDRDDLLANLAAARSGGRPAADGDERTGPPLSECLDSYFVRQADAPASVPPVTSSTALLDQLPDIPVAVRGRGLVEILRPAFVGFGDEAS